MSRRSRHLWTNGAVLLWLVAAAVVAFLHRTAPDAGWMMVHLVLLGGASTAILVWSQHFADTLLRRPGSPRALTVRVAAHTAGAVLVVVGYATGTSLVLVVGATVVVLVVGAQVVGIVRQHRGALPSRFGHLARYYVAAGVLLVPGVACGVAMAELAPGAESYGRLYVAHLALALLGWVGVTVAGTLVVLWPTMLRTRITPAAERDCRRGLPFVAAGPVVLASGPLLDLRWLVGVGAAVALVGIALVTGALVRQARASTPRTFAAWSVAAAVAWWAASVVGMAAVVLSAGSWAVAVPRLSALVPAVVAGFVAQVLVGSLSTLLPVVLGGGPSIARWTVAELDRGAVLRCVLLNGSLLLFLSPVPSAVRVLASLVALGTGITFLVLAARAVWHARRAGRPGGPREAGTPGGAAAAGRLEAGPSGPDAAAGARRRGAVTAGTAVLLLVVVLGVAVDPTAAGLGTVAPGAAGSAGSTVEATGRTTVVEVEAQDMRFVPDRVEVPAGDVLVIRVTNTDSGVHDLVLDGGATSGRLAPGATAEVEVGVVGADLSGWCSVAGHRLMGMTLDVVVTGGAGDGGDDGDGHGTSGESGTDGGQEHAHHGSDGPAGEDAAGLLDLMAAPDDDFVAHDATLAPVGEGTTHHVTFQVSELEAEVAPGVMRTVWTFGGTAPGPVLHGQVGDTFVVTLVNDGTIGHSVDFHAGALAPDQVMRTIAPGESLTYTFTAGRSGVWMYHCSTMPMSLHIANGMTGAVVIDPPGLPEVDHEYLLVQSEVYLSEQGGVADEAALVAQRPDLVVFNGYANQYRDRPLQVRAGERVRVWVLDAGPNKPSAFHVVGGQFDTVYREGDWVLRDGGSTGTGGSQVLALQPAEGGFVELTFPEAGTYPFVSHVMGDAEAGAYGRFEVTP